MLKLAIDGRRLVPVRLIPYLTHWHRTPDQLAESLADEEASGPFRVTPFRLRPYGAARAPQAPTRPGAKPLPLTPATTAWA